MLRLIRNLPNLPTEVNMIDYDKFGHCALCHKDMQKTTVIDGKIQTYLSGEAESMQVKLDDGSKMIVAVCTSCKANYKPSKHAEKLMKSVIRGWEVDCDNLVADKSKPQFDEDWKKNHMKVYGKKRIVS